MCKLIGVIGPDSGSNGQMADVHGHQIDRQTTVGDLKDLFFDTQ
jgi:hypothetical protein